MLAILILSLITALLIANVYRKRKSLPPGPLPFPLIGNIPQVGWMVSKHGGIVEAMKEMKKTYGPVYTLWFGPQPTIHICSMDLAQETMIKRGNEFADRWNPVLFHEMNGEKGIIMSSGDSWQTHRRFTLHTLRNFGFGRAIIEDRIMAEYNMRMKEMELKMEHGSAVVDSQSFFELMVGSIINRLLFSERLEKDQEEEFFALRRAGEETNDFSIFDFFADNQWLRKVPYLNKRWEKMVAATEAVKNFIRRQIRDRMAAVKAETHMIDTENPEDYVDAFLLKMEEDKERDEFNEENLTANLFDLWSAGQETTATTIQSGFVHLLNQPDIMLEARKELLAVTKGERPLSLQDRKNTPYLNALLVETQRHACILGVNLFRKAVTNTEIGGYPVAEGAALAAEISVLMNDDEHFKDPEAFRPSRFIEDPALEKHVLPFGIGKRACPGESLARAEIYLITGNLLATYNFEKLTSRLLKDYQYKEAFFKKPENYEMRVSRLN